MPNTESDHITTAVLLAAGTGSRLQPLTNDAPKCLSEVNGTAILERLVRCLCDNGFQRLVVVVGYLDHRVRDFLDMWTSTSNKPLIQRERKLSSGVYELVRTRGASTPYALEADQIRSKLL